MRGAHMKRKLKYTEKAKVVASWLLHSDQYVKQAVIVSIVIETSKCITLKIKEAHYQHYKA